MVATKIEFICDGVRLGGLETTDMIVPRIGEIVSVCDWQNRLVINVKHSIKSVKNGETSLQVISVMLSRSEVN